jgi:hypothetical protein
MNPNSAAENSTSTDLLGEEDISMEGYDKPVKKARNILFAIAALQFLAGIFLGFQQDGLASIITLGLLTTVAVIFFLLGLWTKRKPFDAIVTALVIYSALMIGDAVFDPSTLIQGIMFKIAIYGLLISALRNARDVQRWKDSQKG